jgi:hypothetical protein
MEQNCQAKDSIGLSGITTCISSGLAPEVAKPDPKRERWTHII